MLDYMRVDLTGGVLIETLILSTFFDQQENSGILQLKLIITKRLM